MAQDGASSGSPEVPDSVTPPVGPAVPDGPAIPDGPAPEGDPVSSGSGAESPADGELPPAANPSERDIDFLLNQAEQALASISESQVASPDQAAPFQLPELQFEGSPASTDAATFDLVRDVQLDVNIELGRTHMYIEDVLKLRKGAVVTLDKMAGDPVDIYVNGRLVARGEVLVLNDNFCVRVAELIVGDGVE